MKNINMSSFPLMLQAITTNNIDTLDLTDITLDKKMREHLLTSLKDNHSIRHLRFANITLIDKKKAPTLIEVLKQCPHLRTLRLQALGLDDTDVKSLAKLLDFFPYLETLFLTDNQIGHTGAYELAVALKQKSTLAELSFNNNNLGDFGCQTLMELLSTHSDLISLTLSHNRLTDNSIVSIAEFLVTNKILKKLYLGDNQFTTRSAVPLLTALQSNTCLISLNIYNNQFSTTEENQFEELIQRNQKKLLAVRTEQTNATIAGEFEFLEQVSAKDANDLAAEGISVEFTQVGEKIEMVLGRGHFGAFTLARHIPKNRRLIGVKEVTGANKILQCKQEGKLHAKVSGKPNIMPLIAMIEGETRRQEPALYLFMPLAGFGNGQFFAKKLSYLADDADKLCFIQHYGLGLLTGVKSMHDSQVAHLDIKPDNTLLDIRGHIYLSDFGCARLQNNGQVPGNSQGSLSYFSPERWLANLDETTFNGYTADLWAVGLTLLEIVLGYKQISFFSADIKVLQDKKAIDEYFETQLAKLDFLQNPDPHSIYGLIKQLLTVDPQQRLTLDQALAHPLFKDPIFKDPENQKQAFLELQKQKMPEEAVHYHSEDDSDEEQTSYYVSATIRESQEAENFKVTQSLKNNNSLNKKQLSSSSLKKSSSLKNSIQFFPMVNKNKEEVDDNNNFTKGDDNTTLTDLITLLKQQGLSVQYFSPDLTCQIIVNNSFAISTVVLFKKKLLESLEFETISEFKHTDHTISVKWNTPENFERAKAFLETKRINDDSHQEAQAVTI